MVVGPLKTVDLRAISRIAGTVVNMVIARDQPNFGCPVVNLVRPFCVSRVSSMISKSSSQEEELAIGDGIFVIVAVVEGEDLPLKASTAASSVPAYDLRFEYVLRELQPATRFRCWQLRFVG